MRTPWRRVGVLGIVVIIVALLNLVACTSRRPTPALDALATHVPVSCLRIACVSDAIHRALPTNPMGIVAIQKDCAVAITEKIDTPTEACLSALAERVANQRQEVIADVTVTFLELIVEVIAN